MKSNALMMASAAIGLMAVGAVLGYALSDVEPVKVVVKEDAVPRKSAKRSDAGLEQIRQLQAKIAELERQLAAKNAKSEVAISNAVAEAVKARPRPGNPREWMENLRKTDPQRYTQMTNRFAQFRRHQTERSQAKMNFLTSLDDSQLSAEKRQTHQSLVNMIARREELMNRMHEEGLSEDQRRQCMDELRNTHAEFERLSSEERNNLMEEAVKAMGFEGDDSQQIISTFNEIIQATDSGFGGPRGMRGAGAPPPPPPQ